MALLQSSRRSQQLFREAADRAKASRARATTGLLRQAAQASAILHDEARTWQDRVLQARQLLDEFGGVTTGSFVSQVRKALAQDVQRVHACLTSLKDLAFGGRKGDRGFEQWKARTAWQGRSAAEFPEGVQLPKWVPLGTVSSTILTPARAFGLWKPAR